jgi:murein DD-endopeptidase MepM/ murein hydrolase activator NlpD
MSALPWYMAFRREAEAGAVPATAAAAKVEVVEGTIRKNTTLVATLVDFDIPVAIAHDVASLIQPVFDMRRLRSGNGFRLEKEPDGNLRKFEYRIDDENILKVEKAADSYEARVEKLPLETREIIVDAEILTSLFKALDDQPKGEILVGQIAQIFGWDVDFHTGIQPHDRVRVIVDAQYLEGAFVKYGPIQGAELINSGKTYRAFRYNDDYYDAKGNAMRRSFLVSPLKFEPRITSGYSRARIHPILGTVQAHLGVDYGAPIGASVIAVANGTVTYAGWKGDFGNYIELKHANSMTSGYGHLSSVGVHVGQPVKQGDTIGAVGQTGMATGPHLHFLISRSGQLVDPTKMRSEPPIPISPGLRPQYLNSIAGLQARLDGSKNPVQAASK